MAINSFEQLDVWQEAHRLVLGVYRLTEQLPSHERYGLISQMRRAAVSVPANIVEGFKRRGLRDKAHFYNIAQASLEELRYFFILCRDLGFLEIADSYFEACNRVGRMLHGLASSVRA